MSPKSLWRVPILAICHTPVSPYLTGRTFLEMELRVQPVGVHGERQYRKYLYTICIQIPLGTTLAALYRGSASIYKESTRCICVRYGACSQ